MKLKLTTCFLALAAAGALYAHEGMDHVIGFARAVTPTTITVETAKHEMVTVVLRPNTEVMKSQVKAHMEDLRIGDRVLVHAEKNKAGKLEAEELDLLGPLPAKK